VEAVAHTPPPTPAPPTPRKRALSPDADPPSRRDRGDREDRAATPSTPTNGKKFVTCKRCGFVGGNARGCGTAHETIVSAATPSIDAGASDEVKTERRGAIADVARKLAGELPRPRSSFLVDQGAVSELDFGDAG